MWRKWTKIIFLFCLLIFLVGCGGNAENGAEIEEVLRIEKNVLQEKILVLEQENQDLLSLKSLQEKFEADYADLAEENAELKETRKISEEKIKDLEEKIELINSDYFAYPERKKFIPAETKFYSYPLDVASVVGLIPQNSVVNIKAVCQMEDGLWLYTYAPHLHDFALSESFGWLPEKNTQPYTEETKKLIEYPLYLEKGTKYYQSFADIALGKAFEFKNEFVVEVIGEKNGYVEAIGPGTFYGWLKKEDLVYP